MPPPHGVTARSRRSPLLELTASPTPTASLSLRRTLRRLRCHVPYGVPFPTAYPATPTASRTLRRPFPYGVPGDAYGATYLTASLSLRRTRRRPTAPRTLRRPFPYGVPGDAYGVTAVPYAVPFPTPYPKSPKTPRRKRVRRGVCLRRMQHWSAMLFLLLFRLWSPPTSGETRLAWSTRLYSR